MKSKIRVKIEEILGINFTTVYIDSTEAWNRMPKVGKYRMKAVMHSNPLNEENKKQIMDLPHVIEVKFVNEKWNSFGMFFPSYLAIYFDCKPKDINI